MTGMTLGVTLCHPVTEVTLGVTLCHPPAPARRALRIRNARSGGAAWFGRRGIILAGYSGACGRPACEGVPMDVLLVEDDPMIVSALAGLLEGEGYRVRAVGRQDEAVAALAETTFDLALLDVTLAQGNGFAVCAAAREAHSSMPVIFLTASDDEFSTVAGLDMGAVDYIAKPFRARELLSRIRVALRTSGEASSVLAAGDVRLDAASATVTKGGREVFLSALEYKLLLYLLQNKGRLITRENLRDAIWDSAGEYVSDNSINVYIRRLREKVEDDPAEPSIVVTVRGLGYKVGE